MALKPWREIIEPHPDVAKGRYRQAEFAADLAQVLSGKAEAEYQDPAEFFRRTYLTPGMVNLLVGAVERIEGRGGDPAVQLETAFGGGKTHSMLALYHALGGKAKARDLLGIPEILSKAGAEKLPVAHIAVLVGTALSPSKPRRPKALGGKQQVRTLWGDMAAQIGGAEGYELVRAADESGTAPGQELDELFGRFGPCLVLIDELVAYARNIYGVSGLSGGSFDSNLTFIQNLTEAAKRSKSSIVVATIPASDIEIGGEGGRAALERIQHTFDRLSVPRASVEAEEGFEIVRRRLFSPQCDEAGKEATCAAFSQMYAQASGDFPQQAREGAYLERLRRAYPIHPEVFDRLYDDWSMLERFQKTRGVLRLLAAAIHELWVRGEQSYLIMPGSLPLDAARVRDELTRYLPEGWNGVVDTDVDGERSDPRKVDEDNPRLGGVMAARRVARTVFLGSAPSVKEQRVRGIEDVRVRLGVVQPGESVAVFNDALGRLNSTLTHLYTDNLRYWYDLPPNLRRTVEDRASRMDWEKDVLPELERRLRLVRERADFRAVHVCPTSADVPDEQEARLVVLSPAQGHRANKSDSPALAAAADILENRGTGPRQFRNMLAFVASDGELTTSVVSEAKLYLAWKSVAEDAEALNLDGHQRKTAADSQQRSDQTVNMRLQEAYCWLLVPTQEATPGETPGSITWEPLRIAGSNETYAVRASKKLRGSEQLIVRWSPALLRMELDRWLWKDEPHIGLAKVWDYLCRYCYLPRLRDSDVLLEAVKEGIRSRDYFGYAGSVDENGKYLGLQIGGASGSIYLDNQSVVVKPDTALEQLEATAAAAGATTGGVTVSPGAGTTAVTGDTTTQVRESEVGEHALPRRFHGSVALDPSRIGRDAGRIAEEVVQHLSGLLGAKVEVTLEIQADIPDGASDTVVRTVTENCRTLRFTTQGFEET